MYNHTTFIPKLIIGVGATGAYFTLRETYLHCSYIGGAGETVTELRSFHHYNLSQDSSDAFDKAVSASEAMGIQLQTTFDSLKEEMREITRCNAEQMAERQKAIDAREEQWANGRKERLNELLNVIAMGKYPIGSYADKEFRDAPIGYVNWILTSVFNDVIMLAIQDAVIANCSDMKLPVAKIDAKFGKEKEKVELYGVTVISKKGFMGYYGYVNVITMVTKEKECIVAMGTFIADVGEILNIKATIKDHDVYLGQTQTKINRVKRI